MIILLGQQSRQTTFFSSMGNILTKSLPDSRTGLSKRDTKLIRKSWFKLCKLHPKAGQLIFKALFTKHPDFMALFQHFKDKDLGVLLSDPQFASLSSAIIQAFGTMISSLDDPAGVVALIRKNATDHTTREGVQPSHFEAMLYVVLEVLQDKLGSRLKPEAVTSWEKLIELIMLLTKAAYDDAAKHVEPVPALPSTSTSGNVFPGDETELQESSQGQKQGEAGLPE